MEKLIAHLEKQLASSRGKNLLVDESDVDLKFLKETVFLQEKIAQLDSKNKEKLIDFVTNRAIEEFYRQNQYYTFDAEAKNELKTIYINLFNQLAENPSDILTVSTEHYAKLRVWLIKTNPFAEETYKDMPKKIDAVACSDYSAELQMELLQIDFETIVEPILDIGCGASKNLIHYFTELGLETVGIDRLTSDSEDTINIDWLEYDYGKACWGTIISNLGFSNHFKHHHLRIDGNYIKYAKKYMAILNALKIGGKFYYAPDLPFIEEYLDSECFELRRFEIRDSDYFGVVVKRLK